VPEDSGARSNPSRAFPMGGRIRPAAESDNAMLIEATDIVAYLLILIALAGVGYLSWTSRRDEKGGGDQAPPKEKNTTVRRRGAGRAGQPH
jgi:hypothetical protein